MLHDVRCFDDLDSFASEITEPLEQLDQDNHHRLISPLGSNPDDPDFGLGLEELLSGELDPAIGSLIEAELRKDRRNATVTALVTPQGDSQLFIDITIVTDDDELLEMNFVKDENGLRRAA
jgi:hypothetical protein